MIRTTNNLLAGLTIGIFMGGLVGCNSNPEQVSGTEDVELIDDAGAPAGEGDWTALMSLDDWRNFKADTIGSAWMLEDGVLTLTGKGGGDLITREEYKNFELNMDWKISEGGNSGLMFHVAEADTLGATYHTGPEYQLLDNERHADAKIEKHRAGDNYDLQKSTVETVKPAGEWNTTRLIVNNGLVEHYLNGEKVVEYELWTPEWEEMVANSKFAQFPAYGLAKTGHIALQDHGDEVSFRKIRVKEL